jgi:HAD superfamily hydrolase (TIGR01549 family)
MDGTLFDSAAVVPDAYRETIVALGGPHYERAQIVEAYSVGPPKALLGHLLGRPVTDEEVAGYLQRLAAGSDGIGVYAGIDELLGTVHGRVPLAVFTGASRQAAELLLAASGLRLWFDEVIGGDEVARSKPWPDGIELACRRLDLPAAEVAYVGDAPVDLQAARRSGAIAVAAGWGHLYSPDEPADLVAARPNDLLELVA